MTPTELASRLAVLDWSACPLAHQLAVAAAVASLSGAPVPSNVLPFPVPHEPVNSLGAFGAEDEN